MNKMFVKCQNNNTREVYQFEFKLLFKRVCNTKMRSLSILQTVFLKRKVLF